MIFEQLKDDSLILLGEATWEPCLPCRPLVNNEDHLGCHTFFELKGEKVIFRKCCHLMQQITSFPVISRCDYKIIWQN